MNLLLIDLSSIAHAMFHVSGTDPNPDATSIKTLERVRALASGQPHVGICVEGGRSFRKDADPTYKANRPEHNAALMHQMDVTIEALKADGFPVWRCEGFEADDVIASAVKLATRGEAHPLDESATDVTEALNDLLAGCEVIIATSDKDLLQLVNERVTVKSLRDGSIIDAAAVEAKFGVRPDQVRDYLSLVGDTADNIKGARGIGEKKAAELLKKYGTLEDLYAALSSNGTSFTPGLATALREFQPRMEAVRELITLASNLPVPIAEAFTERVAADVASFGGEDGMVENQVDTPALSEPAGKAETVPVANGSISETSHAGSSPAPVTTFTGRMMPREDFEAQVRPPTLMRGPTSFEQQLEPQSYTEAKAVALDLFASRLFSAYGHPGGVLATVMAARELGMPAMAGLRAFHIIDGKPAMSADLIRAVVLKSSLCEYFRIKERTPLKATWVTKRRGDPEVELTYTIEEGRAAWQKDQKAWDNSAWAKRPANMVTKTAAATLARLVYPEVVTGMYCSEELTGEERS